MTHSTFTLDSRLGHAHTQGTLSLTVLMSTWAMRLRMRRGWTPLPRPSLRHGMKMRRRRLALTPSSCRPSLRVRQRCMAWYVFTVLCAFAQFAVGIHSGLRGCMVRIVLN